jgi:hypothetical protein
LCTTHGSLALGFPDDDIQRVFITQQFTMHVRCLLEDSIELH